MAKSAKTFVISTLLCLSVSSSIYAQQPSEQLNISPSSVLSKESDNWQFLKPYQATYDVSSEGKKLGQSTREVVFEDNQWTIKSFTKIKKWMISLKSNEYSKFAIKSDQLLTNEFHRDTKITFQSPRVINQKFDWEKQLETGKGRKNNWQLPLKKPVFDRMSHVLELRKDLLKGKSQFNYLISDKGSRKNYKYTKGENERLTTPLGEIEAVRMDREKKNGDRFSIWLCPTLDYLPVKIAQFEKGEQEIILTINKLDLASNIALTKRQPDETKSS